MERFRSPWINVVVALVGGVALGFGIARLVRGFAVGPAISLLLGVILLWWAINQPRKDTPGTPESEVGGDHTIE